MEIEKVQKVILVVEDESVILSMMKRLLQRKFKECLGAANGKEALELLQSDQQIDCVITDISMPVMNGYDLKKEIDRIRPGLPVVAVTGQSSHAHEQDLLDHSFSRVIVKPFMKKNIEDLVKLLEGVSSL